MIRRFCMSGVSRQSGTWPTSVQVTLLAIAEHAVRRGQQTITFVVKRNGADIADRLVLDIGQPGIDLEIFEQAKNVSRGAGHHPKPDIRVTRAKRRRQRGDHAEHGRDRRDPDFARKLLLQRIDLLTHGAGIADDAPRPIQRALAFRRKPLKARAPLHQHHAKNFLQLLEAGRHRRLRDAAGLRGPSEMAFLGERQQKFKLVDQDVPQRFQGS